MKVLKTAVTSPPIVSSTEETVPTENQYILTSQICKKQLRWKIKSKCKNVILLQLLNLTPIFQLDDLSSLTFWYRFKPNFRENSCVISLDFLINIYIILRMSYNLLYRMVHSAACILSRHSNERIIYRDSILHEDNILCNMRYCPTCVSA